MCIFTVNYSFKIYQKSVVKNNPAEIQNYLTIIIEEDSQIAPE